MPTVDELTYEYPEPADWKNLEECLWCSYAPTHRQAQKAINEHVKKKAKKRDHFHPPENHYIYENFLKKRGCHTKAKSQEEREERRAITKHSSYLRAKARKHDNVQQVKQRWTGWLRSVFDEQLADLRYAGT
jgi:hypothetical protein